MNQEKKETGTTTIGLLYDDGVVLGSEKRATMGHLVSGKNFRKIFPVTDRIGITTAGAVGDAQTIIRYMKAEANVYKFNKDKKISTKALTTLLANMLQGSKYYPYMNQFVVGGCDEEGPHVFSLDPLGGVSEGDKYYSTGSGSPMAFGVLEDGYEEDMKEKEAIELVVKAIKSAMKRDTASGEGISIAVINEDGYKDLSEEKIESFAE